MNRKQIFFLCNKYFWGKKENNNIWPRVLYTRVHINACMNTCVQLDACINTRVYIHTCKNTRCHIDTCNNKRIHMDTCI
jgi:hypothetical protein